MEESNEKKLMTWSALKEKSAMSLLTVKMKLGINDAS